MEENVKSSTDVTGAHTPAPWTVEEDENGLMVVMEGLAGEDEYLVIYASPNKKQRLADARLIAAAPELLEALILLVSRFDEAKSNYGFVSRGDLTLARAAIEKATGS